MQLVTSNKIDDKEIGHFIETQNQLATMSIWFAFIMIMAKRERIHTNKRLHIIIFLQSYFLVLKIIGWFLVILVRYFAVSGCMSPYSLSQ